MQRSSKPRQKRARILDYFVPHKRNGYKPHVFRTTSLGVIGAILLVLQLGYFAQVGLVFPKTDLLASVLPSALVSLTNTDRTSNNLSAVTEDATLDQAAQKAAEDMAAKGYFAHVSPDGKTPWYWLQSVGYSYQYAGENLAVNFTDSDQVETAWMNSPTHRANILKGQYTKVGIGVANGTYEGKDATFVVQFFATPKTAASPAPEPAQPVQEAASETVDIGKIALEHSATGKTQKAESNTHAQILGAQATPTQAQPAVHVVALNSEVPVHIASRADAAGFFAQVVTSPTHTLLYILIAFAGVVLMLVGIEFLMKMRMKYIEMTGGGFALLVVLIALIVFNIVSVPKIQVYTPGGAEAAAAIEAGF